MMHPSNTSLPFAGGPWDGRFHYFEGPAPEVWRVAEPPDLATVLWENGGEASNAPDMKVHKYHLRWQQGHWVYVHEHLLLAQRGR